MCVGVGNNRRQLPASDNSAPDKKSLSQSKEGPNASNLGRDLNAKPNIRKWQLYKEHTYQNLLLFMRRQKRSVYS